MPKGKRNPSISVTLEKRRETKSIIKPLQVSLITQKGGWLGPLLKLAPTSSKARNRPLSSHVRGDPGVPAFWRISAMWLFSIRWFIDSPQGSQHVALCHWVVSGPPGVGVWFHPGMGCARAKNGSHWIRTHQWRMDGRKSGNCFLLGSSSPANHGG
jgi:hypothetical protein